MKFFLCIIPLMLGCYHYPHLHHTPRHHVPVHINSDVPIDQATVDEWVDLRVDEWVAHKVDWGCEGLSDGYLEQLAALEPVIIYSGYFLPTDTTLQYMGMNYYDNANPKIEVTVDYPALRQASQWDPYYVTNAAQDDQLYSYGLRQLPHEFTHTARGAWHPNP